MAAPPVRQSFGAVEYGEVGAVIGEWRQVGVEQTGAARSPQPLSFGGVRHVGSVLCVGGARVATVGWDIVRVCRHCCKSTTLRPGQHGDGQGAKPSVNYACEHCMVYERGGLLALFKSLVGEECHHHYGTGQYDIANFVTVA